MSSQSIRDVKQCKSATKTSNYNQRCKKRTAHSEKCWIHLAKINNLRIKNSNVHGKGLFSWKRPIWKGRKIGTYKGKKMTSSQVIRKYGDGLAQYVVCNPRRKYCIDGAKTTSDAVRFANDARRTRYKNNSEIAVKNGKIILRSIRKIKPNQEIFTSYGREYWRKKLLLVQAFR